MKSLPLGNTGVDVSAMCLGTMFFGTRVEEETSRGLLDQFVEAGGTFLDTANAYANWVPGGRGGESEELLGRWMADRGNRDDLFIATKVGFEYDGTDEMPGTQRGTKAEQIEAECEKSLKRLGVETIDLYYAHNDDRSTPLEESLGAFDRLVKAGKVRFVGASNFHAWRLARNLDTSRAGGLAEVVCTQQRHTYLRPKPGWDWRLWPAADDDFMDLCREENLGLCAYTPLLSGAYTRDDKPMPEAYQWCYPEAQLQVLGQVAKDLGATPNQVVLAWMMASDPVVIPLFSCSKPEQLTEDLGSLEVNLDAATMERLDAAEA